MRAESHCLPRYIQAFFFIFIPILVALSLCGCVVESDVTSTKVIRVIDGDTIVIEGGHHIRYIGIDAPELRPQEEYYGQEAWQANRALVEGRKVQLEKDISEMDRHGRLLRYVYVNDIFINAWLVEHGYADAKSYPPDTKYQEYFGHLEELAKEENIGIWRVK